MIISIEYLNIYYVYLHVHCIKVIFIIKDIYLQY